VLERRRGSGSRNSVFWRPTFRLMNVFVRIPASGEPSAKDFLNSLGSRRTGGDSHSSPLAMAQPASIILSRHDVIRADVLGRQLIIVQSHN
jgi:hypothetical protein